MPEDYKKLEETYSLCNICEKKISAQIIEENYQVFILKKCSEHGEQKELLEEDAEYHKRKKEYDKPGTITPTQTIIKKGCPYDCGLCPQHKQHSCNAVVDITQQCNLNCPTCYASSGRGKHKSLNEIEKMLDFFQKSENNQAEILQISGGEPTLHPNILKIIEIAKSKNFRYVLLNTNGIKIAEDENFAKELSKFRGRFAIYLQFDGFKESTYQHLRGRKDLLKTKLKAIENLRKYKIPITLVATIEKDINDDEIGQLFEFGINTNGIRGINFQPITFFGRVPKEKTENRITLSGIINRLEKQTKQTVLKTDIIPLPCNVHRVGIGFFFKKNKNFLPVTRVVNVKSYLPLIDNTFAFDAEKLLKEKSKIGVLGNCCVCMKAFLSDLNKFIPENYNEMQEEEQIKYWDENSFMVSISSFIDKYNFDEKSMQKECVHFITPDLKRIPFSTYNMIYRNNYKE
jgi:uncharacterized radical SAM superfamily Fe-S cluster-containing enzyme